MALTGTDRGTGTHNTSATTFTLSPGSNFAAGMAVLVIAADNSSAGGSTENFVSVTDTLGNAWLERLAIVYDPGAANAGVQGAVYTTIQTAGTLTTGTTITVTFGVATTAKAWTLMEVTSGANDEVWFVNAAAGANHTGTTPTVTSLPILEANMIIGVLFNEQGTGQTITQDSDSTNGSWSTQQTAEVGTTAAGMSVASQRKVVTATATQSYNPTLGVSSDSAIAWVQLTQNRPWYPYTGGGYYS